MILTDLPAGPSVLVDAMALGRAVIATDTPGTRDYVDDGVTGWLVPPGDPDAMADAIRNCLADDAARERIGHAAARPPGHASPSTRSATGSARCSTT